MASPRASTHLPSWCSERVVKGECPIDLMAATRSHSRARLASRTPIRLWDDLSGCEEREHAPLTVPLEILRNYAQKL